MLSHDLRQPCCACFDAERMGGDLVLDVLAVNRRARALYRRLGLTEVPGTATAASRSPYGPPVTAGRGRAICLQQPPPEEAAGLTLLTLESGSAAGFPGLRWRGCRVACMPAGATAPLRAAVACARGGREDKCRWFALSGGDRSLPSDGDQGGVAVRDIA